MPMELTDLRIFVAIAQEMSATRAADLLGMTQPGVSQHLAKLEAEIGMKLFDRIGKKLELNDFGRTFLGRAQKLLQDADSLIRIAEGPACPIGNLNLGLTDSSTLTVIPPALKKFHDLYPGVHVRMDVNDSSDIERELLRGHYDLGIVTAGTKTHPLLDEETLYVDRIDALVNTSHPLASKKRISLKTLAQWPLLLYPRKSRTRALIDDAFHRKGIFPKETIEVYFNSAAVKLAELGVGVALLSDAFIESELPKKKCVKIRIEGNPFNRDIAIARRRNTHMSEAANRFYDLLISS
jgi:DNA-binding transcriptional LysR family regulator